MLLTIDVGNTNLTLGLYNGNTLFAHWRLATDHARMPDEYGLQLLGLLQNAGHTKKDLNGICLASVVPQLTGRVLQACREYLENDPFIVDVGIKTGIKVRYEDPRAVGADRIADAVAVMYLYGGPACVIDFGTATTFNALTKEGEYLGGAITLPGTAYKVLVGLVLLYAGWQLWWSARAADASSRRLARGSLMTRVAICGRCKRRSPRTPQPSSPNPGPRLRTEWLPVGREGLTTIVRPRSSTRHPAPPVPFGPFQRSGPRSPRPL